MEDFDPVQTCQNCGKRGKVSELFGWREHNGEKKPQPWCRECRENPPGKKPREEPPVH